MWLVRGCMVDERWLVGQLCPSGLGGGGVLIPGLRVCEYNRFSGIHNQPTCM